MRIRTLLLESTAALTVIGGATAVVGGAQAADKVVKPAPVQYVQVCDAYGIGFFILPGQKDVCLRVQGQVQFQINFHSRDTVFYSSSSTSWHDAGWDFQSQGQVTFTAKRQTDHGPLTGVIRLTGTSSNSQSIQLGTATVATALGSSTATGTATATATNSASVTVTVTNTVTNTSTGAVNITPNGRIATDRLVQVDRVWLQLGNFKVGYDSSVYGIGTTKQVALNWTIGGYGVAIAIDDPRDRWGSRLPRYFIWPDLVASITGAPKWGTWGLSGGLSEVSTPATAAGTGTKGMVWGVSAKATINTPGIAKGDQLSFAGSVGTGCAFISNNCGNGTDNRVDAAGNPTLMWTGMVGFKHVMSSAWNTNWTFQWWDPNPAAERWQASANLVWQGITNFQVATRVRAMQTTNNAGTALSTPVRFDGQVQLQWQY